MAAAKGETVVSGNADMKKNGSSKGSKESRHTQRERERVRESASKVQVGVALRVLVLPVSLSLPSLLPAAVSLLSAANTATCTQADNVKYHSRMAMAAEAGEGEGAGAGAGSKSMKQQKT